MPATSFEKDSMPNLNISIPHSLSQAEAAQRIRSLLNNLKAEHSDKINDLKEEWVGHTGKFACSVMGFRVSSILAIEPAQVSITGNLPLAAMLFKSRIESMIRDQTAKLLA